MKKVFCYLPRLILTASVIITTSAITIAQVTGSSPSGSSAMTDTAFISKNIMDNMMEIQLSQMGTTKATDPKIKAVIDLFGPADLTDLYNHHPIPQEARYVLTNLLGKTPVTAPSLYQQASPINFVNGKTVPTLIFHGSNDIVVPITQSNTLKAKLLDHNVKVEMTSYALEGHGWYGKNLLDTYNKTVEFIKKNVN